MQIDSNNTIEKKSSLMKYSRSRSLFTNFPNGCIVNSTIKKASIRAMRAKSIDSPINCLISCDFDKSNLVDRIVRKSITLRIGEIDRGNPNFPFPLNFKLYVKIYEIKNNEEKEIPFVHPGFISKDIGPRHFFICWISDSEYNIVEYLGFRILYINKPF